MHRPELLGKGFVEESKVLNWLSWSPLVSPDELKKRKGRAFVYTEVQLSVPFDQAPWKDFNDRIVVNQPGFTNKTWLSGLQNNSVGGFYEFDSVENAKSFALDYFPNEAKKLGAAFTVRVFPAGVRLHHRCDINQDQAYLDVDFSRL
eukprot:TRINITY_DN10115_c0_g1_i1.p1 TRINITY_DN10115_c0_g1~~TRINITY_DN10115_c0_g1_i1.p1  ORF type:complete len:147 (+),score=31.06 TRINITY_DN10115_c0_g1_i1:278-718(+)